MEGLSSLPYQFSLRAWMALAVVAHERAGARIVGPVAPRAVRIAATASIARRSRIAVIFVIKHPRRPISIGAVPVAIAVVRSPGHRAADQRAGGKACGRSAPTPAAA